MIHYFLWYFTGRHWTDSVFVWTCILFIINLETRGFLCLLCFLACLFIVDRGPVFVKISNTQKCVWYFVLSVPVQVIAWKDSSLKWPIMCWVGRKTLLTHSVTPLCFFFIFVAAMICACVFFSFIYHVEVFCLPGFSGGFVGEGSQRSERRADSAAVN